VSTTKKRSLAPQYKNLGRTFFYFDRYNGSTFLDRNWRLDMTLPSFPGTQSTASEGHPWHSRNKPKMTEDIGGDFFTTKSFLTTAKPPTNEETLGKDVSQYVWDSAPPPHPSGQIWNHHKFQGMLLPVNPSGAGIGFPPSGHSSDAVLDVKGATAISRCQPTNSLANLSTFIGELIKDGLPSMPGIATWEGKLKAAVLAGDEFLNVVFGWSPLVADIKSTAKAIHHANTVIKQFERDSGKVVRRRYHFDTEKSEDTQKWVSNTRPYYGAGSTILDQFLGTWDVYRTRKTVRSTWFSGAFTYHLPKGYNSRKAMDRAGTEAKRVFGLELTPEVLWNLTPWSWAIDWVTNAGDVLANVSAWEQYGLVMKYGYVMETTTVTDTYMAVQTAPGSDGRTLYCEPMHMVTVTKKRRRANPFGFGVSWDGLSALQQAILAALGLSRSR